MIHKLLAGKGRMKKAVSLLLCLALLGSSVISTNVSAADVDTDVTVEAETAETVAVEEAGIDETTDETTGDESPDESTGTGTADEAASVGEETTSAEEQNKTVSENGETPAAEESTAETTKEATANDEMPAVTLEDSADGVSVIVNAPEGAFTESVTMEVSEVDVNAFADAVVADCVASDGGTYTVYDAAAVEISFYDVNGTKIQPATEVEVTLGNLDLNTGDNDLTKYAIIYHMNDDGTMEYIADGNPGESSYTFSASSFSAYGLIIASVEYDVEAIPGGGGFYPGGDDKDKKELDPSAYNEDAYVYWDTFSEDSNGNISAGNSTTGIDSVYMGLTSSSTYGVVHYNSGMSNYSDATGGQQLETYFPGAEKGNDDEDDSGMVNGVLIITPSDGYYVTRVVVACTGPSGNMNEYPYNCDTWSDGNAFDSEFGLNSSGTVVIDVSSLDFSHSSNSPTYWILIEVAPIPSPLYVEYDYGNIVSYIAAISGDCSAFNSITDWTDTGTSTEGEKNNYGTGGVQTADTQYKYAYDGEADASKAAEWTHYANTITEAAKKQAAAAGYVFVGWKAEYYTEVTVTENQTSNSLYSDYYTIYNNTYDFDADSAYGTATYDENEEVKLTTNVRLIAQWIPIGIKVTKTVSGIAETEVDGDHIYTLQLYNSTDGGETWAEYGETFTLTVNGDGEASTYIYPLPAGTYKVVETDGTNLTGTTETYYITVSYGNNVTVTYSSAYTVNSEIAGDGTSVAFLTSGLSVVNSYADKPITISIPVEKVWNDNDDAGGFRPEEITIKLYADGVATDNTLTLNDGNDWNGAFENLEKFSGDTEIVYTVVENDVSYYSADVSGSAAEGYTIKNTLNDGYLEISKTVTGNIGDTTKSFSFSLTLTANDGSTLYKESLAYTKTTASGNESGSLETTNGTYTFDLKDGESIKITIPEGYTYTITEDSYGYTSVSVKTDDGSAVDVTNSLSTSGTVSGTHTIEFINERKVQPDTGLSLDSAPYILMLAGVAVLGGVVLFRRRRRLL